MVEPLRKGWLELRLWQKLAAAGLLAALLSAFLWTSLRGEPQAGAPVDAGQEKRLSFSANAKPHPPDAAKHGEAGKGEGFGLLESYAGEQERRLRDLEERVAATIAKHNRCQQQHHVPHS